MNDEEKYKYLYQKALDDLIKSDRELELAKEQLKKQCEIADERNDLLVKVIELQKENKKLNSLYKKEFSTLNKIIKEKNKQIDLMVEYISNLDIDEDICKKIENNCDDFNKENKCIDCINKYFESKSKEK